MLFFVECTVQLDSFRVANSSEARLLRQAHGTLKVLEAFFHPANPLHSSELGGADSSCEHRVLP